jgi:hypothetical protein
MIPYKPHSLTAVPRIAQVQSEIAKAVVVLASQYGLGKFDPDQPRAPAGNSDGGQWTSTDGAAQTDNSRTTVMAARSARSEAECLAQYEKDSFICRAVGTRLCWQQAAERLAACLSGRQLPPLNF